ncbi:MAG: methyltransferase [Burkholderiaceae bacterium]
MSVPLFSTAETAAAARFEAQRIAFAPVVFQVVQVLRREGLLRALVEARDWVEQGKLRGSSGLSLYAKTVLLETACAAGIVEREEPSAPNPSTVRWRATMVGRVIERDPMVRVNMDFVGDVCYRGLSHLGEALRSGTPSGLAELGPWKTFYEGMAQMPEPARTSWFNFDHYYSDSAFPDALDALGSCGVTHIADVGANTGRFAVAVLRRFPASRITLCDLPQQLVLAKTTLEDSELLDRAAFHPCDLLDDGAALPSGPAAPDAFWMSQFLCCFSESQVVNILALAAKAVGPRGSIFVLDTFWDAQRHDLAAYCLINTSPYFCSVANGNSRMYRLDVLTSLAAEAGLEPRQTWHHLGQCHTLVQFQRQRADGRP